MPLVFNQALCHGGIWWSGGMVPSVLNLAPATLHPFDSRLVGSENWAACFGGEKDLLPLPINQPEVIITSKLDKIM